MFLMYSRSYLLLVRYLHYRSISYRSCRLHYLPLNASLLYYHSLLLFVGCRSILHLSSGILQLTSRCLLCRCQLNLSYWLTLGLSLTPLPLRYHSLPVLLMCLCMFLMYSQLPAIRRYLHYKSINYRSCRLHYLPLSASLLYYHSLLLFVGCRSILHLSSGILQLTSRCLLCKCQLNLSYWLTLGLSLTPLPLRYHSLPELLMCLCMFLMYSRSCLLLGAISTTDR